MSSWVGKIHDFTGSKWATPELRLTHKMLDGVHKSSTKAVEQTSDGLAQGAESLGINSHLPRTVEGKADRDHGNFGRWGENSLGGVGAVAGGMYAYGAAGAGGTAAGAAEAGAGTAGAAEAGAGAAGAGAAGAAEAGGGAGAAVGAAGEAGAPSAVGYGAEGVNGYNIPGSGGEGWSNSFDPNGMPEGSSKASDIPSKSGNSGWKWSDMLKKGGQGMQQQGAAQQAKPEVNESDVRFERPDYQGDPYAYSSRDLKTGPRASMREVMARGASGADPIDQNGVHMASIQALTKRLTNAKARLEKLKGKHA